ncbi:hypothetical protein XI09_40955 [Bradyrhizobium sp. CCBAU 11386]|uniref:hypothetical protein n=1 Tax=Bradyrhizobium sp. CCBAU 11386 TaxID=1630837 RepID=UPI002304A649|nr:hypothetical protein [Bradyrhizobium sp. CCBAU 11386]MDA9510920.1 hypothetical protein [Bradyrhizobium sp. CCBAU 11386]
MMDDAETKLFVYTLASKIMGPPLFPRPPSPAPAVGNLIVDSIVADLSDLIANATALRDRVAAASTASASPITTPTRTYRNAAEAFRDRGFPFNDQKVRRLCRANAIGKPSGAQFAQMLAGTWHVILPAFEQWADRL